MGTPTYSSAALADAVVDLEVDEELAAFVPQALAPYSGDALDVHTVFFEAVYRRDGWYHHRQGLAAPAPLPPEWVGTAEPSKRLLDELWLRTSNVLELRFTRGSVGALPKWLEERFDRAQLAVEGRYTPLTEYRSLLVIRWLLSKIDAQVWVEQHIRSLRALVEGERLKRIRSLCEQLLREFGFDGAWPAEGGHSPSGPTVLHDLPLRVLSWPQSLQQIVRSVLETPAADLDREQQTKNVRALLVGEEAPQYVTSVRDEYEDAAGGRFEPFVSKRRDPFAVQAAVALSRALADEVPKRKTDRCWIIAAMLNGSYPQRYRSPNAPGVGPGDVAPGPAPEWDPRTVESWLLDLENRRDS